MTAPGTTKLLRDGGILLLGTVDQVAATPVGYIKKGTLIEVEVDRESFEFEANNYPGVIFEESDLTGLRVKAAAAQFDSSNLSAALGNAASATQQIGGDSPTARLLRSVKVIAQCVDGTTTIANIPAAYVPDNLAFALDRKNWSELPFSFRSLDGPSRGATLLVAGGEVNLTIAAGVLTRTVGPGYCRVFGEALAADTLDSITGASLTDEEILVMQLGSAAEPITLTHLNGTLELLGDIDWVMDTAGDFIVLQYSTSGTSWSEIGRFDAQVPA